MRYGRNRPRDFVRGLGFVPRQHPRAYQFAAYQAAHPGALQRTVVGRSGRVLDLAGPRRTLRGLGGTPLRIVASYTVRWQDEATFEQSIGTLLRFIHYELGGEDFEHDASRDVFKLAVTFPDGIDQPCDQLRRAGDQNKPLVFRLASCEVNAIEAAPAPEPTPEPEPEPELAPAQAPAPEPVQESGSGGSGDSGQMRTVESDTGAGDNDPGISHEVVLTEPAPMPTREPAPIPTVSDPEPAPAPTPAPTAVVEEPPPVIAVTPEPAPAPAPAPAQPRCRWLCALIGGAIGLAGGAVIASGRNR